MSGRSGYRKTQRKVERKPRLAAHLLPERRLTFTLPVQLGSFVAIGETGVMGVRVTGHGGQVEVIGRDRGWMFKQAAMFLQKIARGHNISMVVSALFETPDEEPVTAGGPIRKGGRDTYQIAIVSGEQAIVVARTGIEPVIFASRTL